MKTWRRVVAAWFAATVVAACSTVAANHDFNPATNFDTYKTFSWISAHPLVDPTPTPMLEGRIQQIARDLLSAKGYRFVEDPAQADFLVGFGLGASDKLRIDTYPAAYRGQWHWRPGAHDVTVRPRTEGRLVVDIFDVRTHQPVWHGWATRSLTTNDLRESSGALRTALTAIFANFPPS